MTKRTLSSMTKNKDPNRRIIQSKRKIVITVKVMSRGITTKKVLQTNEEVLTKMSFIVLSYNE